jgi:hypothetical protein
MERRIRRLMTEAVALERIFSSWRWTQAFARKIKSEGVAIWIVRNSGADISTRRIR